MSSCLIWLASLKFSAFYTWSKVGHVSINLADGFTTITNIITEKFFVVFIRQNPVKNPRKTLKRNQLWQMVSSSSLLKKKRKYNFYNLFSSLLLSLAKTAIISMFLTKGIWTLIFSLQKLWSVFMIQFFITQANFLFKCPAPLEYKEFLKLENKWKQVSFLSIIGTDDSCGTGWTTMWGWRGMPRTSRTTCSSSTMPKNNQKNKAGHWLGF